MPDLVCFFGQSNSRGAAPNADLAPALLGPQTGIQMWNGTAFATLQAGTNQSYPTPDTFSGAQMRFMKNFQAARGTTVYSMMYAVGGTKLAVDGSGSDWNAATRGELLDAFISTLNNALAYMWNTLRLRTNYKIFLIWQQGESDTVLTVDANAYGPNFAALYTRVMLNFNCTAFANAQIVWLLPLLNTLQTYDPTNLLTIKNAVISFAALDPTRRFTLATEGQTLQADGHHYEASGYATEAINLMAIVTNNNQ